MNKIRVLHFPLANSYSGVTQYVLQNWKFIDHSRFHFDYATLSKTKLHFEDEVKTYGSKVYYISCYAEENEERFHNEVGAILKGYDVVHLHTSYWKSFEVEKIARKIGVPKIIIHSHNTDVLGEENRTAKTAQHWHCVNQLDESIATDFWACSQAAADWLYGNSIPKDRIVIQKNAIDVERFRYNPDVAWEVRRKLGWEDKYIIGHVGRFTYQKNHEFLLRVFKEVYGTNSEARLLLVGVGPELSNIRDMIQDWHLEDRIQIMCMRNDVHRLLQAVDVFAFPSRFEGFPIVLVEAQTAGCQCIISDLITDEVVITNKAKRLSLIESIWKDEILNLSQNREGVRGESVEEIKGKGFDLREQIHKIEEGYSVSR